MADEETTADNAGGEEQGKADGDRFAKLEGSIGELANSVKALVTNQAKLSQRLEETDDILDDGFLDILDKSNQEAGKGSGGSEKGGDEFDPNTASVAQTYNRLSKQIADFADGVKKALEVRDQAAAKREVLRAARVDLDLTMMRHPEFAKRFKSDPKVKQRYVDTADKHPTLDAEGVYEQFVMVEQATAAAEEQAKKEEAEKANSLSTEKGGVPIDVVTDKEMSDDEIAAAAADAIFGKDKQIIGPTA